LDGPLAAHDRTPDPIVEPLPSPPPPLPTPSAVSPGAQVDLALVDVAPAPRARDLPRYTRRARRAGEQGTVHLSVLIDHHGEVETVRLADGIPGSELNQLAVDTARRWRFSPARKDGVPVRVWKEVRLEFSILAGGTTRVRIED
jgi:protein TonB